MRLIKLSPELVIELLQGKTFSLNLPQDCELLDIKYDSFTHEVSAIIRSDSFEEITETYPIPELILTKTVSAKPAASTPAQAPAPGVPVEIKTEDKPAPKPAVQPQPSPVSSMEDEFSPDQRKLLNFVQKEDCLIVKPAQFLKEEWAEINDLVKSLGGKWVKGDIISYWEIPNQ
ncbi:MAG: hypothetical protein NWF01_12075 [Candidatus Bathyarchaeota archaeon]|nr:hypothetical protein [Candidatus Bathyarchaeota archaeon]